MGCFSQRVNPVQLRLSPCRHRRSRIFHCISFSVPNKPYMVSVDVRQHKRRTVFLLNMRRDGVGGVGGPVQRVDPV